MELSDDLKNIFTETAQILKNSDRRIFMARVVKALGKGGQRYAEDELNWNRDVIRKGMHELERGIRCIDHFSGRGRKPIEEHLPNLIEDIDAIVKGQSQTDPTFKTTRLYTRLSSAEVRQQLIEQKRVHRFRFTLRRNNSSKITGTWLSYAFGTKKSTEKKIPQTNAIFDQLNKIHAIAKNDETVLRISIDAKASVLVRPFSRGGNSRVIVKAADHDFQPEDKLTPIGIFLPEYDDIRFYFSNSHTTSDFIVDCMHDFWSIAKQQFPYVKTLLVNLDNGPENNSRRTQFMNRLTQFADEFQIDIQLAYYPPYHSKYNPIERVWGVLEQHWNGSLLDTKDAVIRFAQTMKWNGKNPIVNLVEKCYQTGVSLTQKAMAQIEKRLERLEGLEKWYAKISSMPTKTVE